MPRRLELAAEHEPQHAHLVRPPDEGGLGLDAIYNEDFHHCLKVALTGERDAYLSDYTGDSREWLSAVRRGFLFQGQYYPWQEGARGRPAFDLPAARFVAFLENHDQVANSLTGARLVERTSPAWWRAMSAFLLLGPWTPLLFQGQEWGSRTPFRFFADHEPTLQAAVSTGRAGFLSQFGRVRTAADAGRATDVGRSVFEHCLLDHPSRPTPARQLFRDLTALRANDGTLGQHAVAIDGVPLDDRTLLLRFFGTEPAADRLLVVNLGPDRNLLPLSEPLVAAPEHRRWALLWCSEQPEYDGHGVAASDGPARLIATGHATTVFAAEPLA
jgi:maltooligosyltrehalose trehalohydrolase